MAIKPPTILQAFLITTVAGLLAFFGCIGVLSAVTRNYAIPRSATMMLVIGGSIFLVGALYLGVFIVKAIWQSLTRNRQKREQPPDPPAASPEI